MIDLGSLGWNGSWQAWLEAECQELGYYGVLVGDSGEPDGDGHDITENTGNKDQIKVFPARVTAVHRGSFEVCDGHGYSTVDFSLPTNCSDSELWPPVVGDWVAVDGSGAIRIILHRSSYIERPGSQRGKAPQPVCANVDLVGIVEPMFPEPAAGRVERLAAIARTAGLPILLLLSKTDLTDDTAVRERSDIRDGATPVSDADMTGIVQPTQRQSPVGVKNLREADEPAASRAQTAIDTFSDSVSGTVDAVIALSSHRPASILPLLDVLGRGRTIALLGRSGAGKSTLTNLLTGSEQTTRAVRQSDGKGRHTTTTRQLFVGEKAIVIDTPGIRSVPVGSEQDSVESVFPDILELARACRFRDCQHKQEPSCAVRAAVDAGELDLTRLERYMRMMREFARKSQWDARTLRAHQRTATKQNTSGRRESMRLKGRDN